MKKTVIGICLLCLFLCFQSVFADGTCGTNVKYTVSGDTIDFSRNDSAADAVWGTNCKTAVTGNSAVTKITVSQPIRVTNAVAMFRDLSNITEMDLEKLDVSGATDMYEMFKGCSKLSTLNVATWDTSNVTDMYEMFSGCSSLNSLDVSNWDTSKVVHMHGMFSGCERLSSLDVSNWDTSAVTDMSGMFYYCDDLISLDVSEWDTSSVTDMSRMFYYCGDGISLDVSAWNTSNVTNMSEMFYQCWNMSSLDVSAWNTSNVTDMSGMFYYCDDLVSLDVSGWDTSAAINMSGMFHRCSSLNNLNVSGWDTSNVINMFAMFSECSNLTDLDVSGWDTSNVTNMGHMFNNCRSLSSLDLSGWDTFNVTDMSNMFYYCSSLTSLDLSDWDTSRVLTMNSMFSSCHKLSNLNVSGWNTSSVTDLQYLFQSCTSLSSLDLSSWNFNSIEHGNANDYMMFDNCGLNRITFGKNSLNGNRWYTFEGFPRLDHRWYYIAAGPEASSPLPLGSFKENGELFDNYNSDTMAGTWATICSLSIMSPAGVDVSDQRIITSDETCQLTVSIDPAPAPQKAEWASSRTNIAEVDPTGKVTFKASGTVTITATAPNSGGISAEMELTYSPSAPVVSILNADHENVTRQTLRINGDTIQLTGSIEPGDGSFSTSWSGSDPDIAEVDATGKVTFLTPGMVTVGFTVTAEDGSLQFASVKVTNLPPAEEIKITDAEGNDISGQTVSVNMPEYQLSASTLPAEAAQEVSWSSNDTTVAVVDQTGNVTSIAAGTVRITAEAEGSGVSVWVELLITPRAESVDILDPDGNRVNDESISIYTNEYQLEASASPEDAAQEFIWKSSDPDIANVDKTGKVTFKRANEWITITVKAVDGSEISENVEIYYDGPDVPYAEEVMILDPDGNDISRNRITVYTSEYQLDAEILPSEALQLVTWSSNDPDIAEVDSTGKVTFKEAWTAVTIYAEAESDCDTISTPVYLTYAASSGTCGTNVEFSISDGTITFSGNGSGNAEWGYSCKTILDNDSSISKVLFSDKVRVTDAAYMFSGLSGIEEMNLAKLDVSGAEDFSGMFEGCSSLTRLNMSGWDTSNAQNMSSMFFGCSSLESLDLSGWDISGVTNMYMMFYGCTDLSSLNVSSWNTSNVNTMTSMFYGCRSLESLDLSGWDTFNVQSMSAMFSNCTSLRSLNVSGWNTSGVINMANMFAYCESLDSLDVSGWATSRVDNMYSMFRYCSSLTGLDVSGWDVSRVTNISAMFFHCHSLDNLDVSRWKPSRVTLMGSAFQDCRSLKELDVSGWNTASVTNLGSMFRNCFALTALDAGNWNTSGVTSMSQMFYNCTNLTSLNVSGWDTSQVTTMQQMFYNCGSLGSLDLSSWNPVNVTSLTDAFYGCYNISSLTLGKNTLNRNIFTALPKYYGSWYYDAQGTGASAPLDLGTEKKGGTLFTEYDSNTMAGTWSVNKNQKPLVTALTIITPSGKNANGRTLTGYVGSSYTYTITPDPSTASKAVTWKSAKTGVAAITTAGKATCKGAGSAKITATAKDGSGVTASFTLKCAVPKMKSMSIMTPSGKVANGKSLTGYVGSSYTYTIKPTPAGASKAVTWKSSKTGVVAITTAGKATCKTAGSAKITATAKDGSGVTASFTLKCVKK